MLRRRVRFAKVLAPTLRRDGSDGWDRPLFQFCRLEEDRDHHQSQDAESNGCVSTPIFGIRPPSTGRTPHVFESSCVVPVSASHVSCFPSKLSHARVESNWRSAQAAARASRNHGSETQCAKPRPPFHAPLHVLPSTPRQVQETPPSRAAKLPQARRSRARFDGTFSMRRHVRSNGFEPERSSNYFAHDPFQTGVGTRSNPRLPSWERRSSFDGESGETGASSESEKDGVHKRVGVEAYVPPCKSNDVVRGQGTNPRMCGMCTEVEEHMVPVPGMPVHQARYRAALHEGRS